MRKILMLSLTGRSLAMAAPLLIGLLGLCAQDAQATEAASGPVLSVRPGDQCSWEAIGMKWGVNPHILYAIAKTESGFDPLAVNGSNRNGSEDVGLMQINSFWYPTLASHNVTREDLFDPCVSLDVAGWVMAQNMTRLGNTWRAVGAYNAVTPSKQVTYAWKIFRNLPETAN